MYVILAKVMGESAIEKYESAIFFTGIYGFGLILIKFILGFLSWILI